jgi:hypothetical protein
MPQKYSSCTNERHYKRMSPSLPPYVTLACSSARNARFHKWMKCIHRFKICRILSSFPSGIKPCLLGKATACCRRQRRHQRHGTNHQTHWRRWGHDFFVRIGVVILVYFISLSLFSLPSVILIAIPMSQNVRAGVVLIPYTTEPKRSRHHNRTLGFDCT